ncbi:MAG: DUF2911 domain-containing protein [Sphingobacteriales bacterium]|nr:MAG: DUF2911 domain-containing protein [Sphingobacteriales bacterium]
MKKLMLMLTAVFAAKLLFSQGLTVPPNGGNKKAVVGERIGITDVSIHYDRPGVKGREGKIYGTSIVHYGYTDLGFGTSKAAPWRAGANENTTIEFTTDVKVEGNNLPAGKYALFIAMGADEATVIFSKNSSSWGSFFYDPKEDALKVKVKPVALAQSTEWLKYEFENETPNSAVVALSWEKVKVPFKVEVDLIKTQLESFRKELRSDKGFNADAWAQAAQFCVDNNTNLEEALQWSDYSINGVFVGQKTFVTLSTKASVLEKLGKQDEADAIMKEALPLSSEQDVHQYGRSLIARGKKEEALKVFKMNYDKHPNSFTTLMGLTRGYSANGDYKNALKYAKQAVAIAPTAQKGAVEEMIKKLEAGKDVN